MTWRDISTAPKNERVLICDRSGHRQIAIQDDDGGWLSDSHDLLDALPAKWMPLPEAE